MSVSLDPFEHLTLDQKALVNRVCEGFEQALQSGQQPRLEEYLADAAGPTRSVLFREVLLLEYLHRLREHSNAVLAELTERFPGEKAALQEVARRALHYAQPLPSAQREAGAASAVNVSEAGKRVGRFRLKRVLGIGGFATVYLAEDPDCGRDVALKVPHLEILLTPVLRERFLQEAKAAARLDHPHLAKVLEWGEAGIVCYIASAYVQGLTLKAWLKERSDAGESVPPGLAAQLVAALADAIQHAHERDVLHCDLKPSNVLLVEGPEIFPTITDFGLARIIGERSDMTRTGLVLGTPAYMAPEQAAGKRREVTARTDVYGLGTILYELLTGRAPFAQVSTLEVLLDVLTAEPVRPRSIRRDLPADLEAVCLKCLEKQPERRYASAGALAEDLRRFAAGGRTHARPAGLLRQSVKWVRHHPVLGALAACGLLAVVGAIAGLFFHNQRLEMANESLRKALAERDEYNRRAGENLQDAERDAHLAHLSLNELLDILASPHPPGSDGDRDLRHAKLQRVRIHLDLLNVGGGRSWQRRGDTAGVSLNLAMYLRRNGSAEQAREILERVVPVWGTLLQETPGNAACQEARAVTLKELMLLYSGQGNHAAARHCAARIEEIIEIAPAQEAALRAALGHCAVEASACLRRGKALAESLRMAEHGRAIFADLWRLEPGQPLHGVALSEAWAEIGKALWQLGPPARRQAALEAAVNVARLLHAQYPAETGYRRLLADRYGRLARCLSNQERLIEAGLCLREQESLGRDDGRMLMFVAGQWMELARDAGEGPKRVEYAARANKAATKAARLLYDALPETAR